MELARAGTYSGITVRPFSETRQLRHMRKTQRLFTILMLSALGPYLSMGFGLRIDHVVIYSFVLFAVFKHLSAGRVLPSSSTLANLALISTISLLWALTITFVGGYDRTSSNQVLAEVENELQPLALMFILSWWTTGLRLDSLKRLLHFVSVLLCVVLSLHAVLQIASLQYDIWPFIAAFVRHEVILEDSPISVWAAAKTMGRHCGLFQLPIEAGVAYCTGLVAWMYWSTTVQSRSFLLWTCLPLIIVGGLLPVSKVFLLGAPMLVLTFFALVRGRPRIAVGVGIAGFLIVSLTWFPQFAEWEGPDRISGLFASEVGRDVLNTYTAGRLDTQGGWTGKVTYDVMLEAPLSGYGYASGIGPYDSAFMERMVTGGVPMLLLYLAALAVIGNTARYGLRVSRIHGAVLACIFLLVVGTSFGSPVLSMNRSSIWLWVFLALSVRIIETSRRIIRERHRELRNAVNSFELPICPGLGQSRVQRDDI